MSESFRNHAVIALIMVFFTTSFQTAAASDAGAAFNKIIGGEQGEPWEDLTPIVSASDQNGFMIQSFSFKSSSSTDCGKCLESSLHNVQALTPDELKANFSSESSYQNLYPRDGDHVIRFYGDGRNNPDDGAGGGPSNGDYTNRAELATNRVLPNFTSGDSRYYSLSFWAPKEVWDRNVASSTVISQWKQFGGGNPNFEVRLSATGSYELLFRSLEHDINYTTIGKAKPNQWNDLKYYVKHSSSSGGVLRIWLNGEEIYSYTGKTMYKSGVDGYIKFGMYTEFKDERVLLWDAVRITDSLNGKTLADWAIDQQHLPSVTLSLPANKTQYAFDDTITLSADAHDPAGRQLDSLGQISKVAFYANDVLIRELTAAPYIIDWHPDIEGAKTLTAKVWDADGNEATSVPLIITLGNLAPTVVLTSNNDNDSLALNQAATLTASASDADGTIDKVIFYVNSTVIGEATSTPYSISWTPVVKGDYLLTARAIDNDGAAKGASAAVSAGATISSMSLPITDDKSVNQSKGDEIQNDFSTVGVYARDYKRVGLFRFDLSNLPGDVRVLTSDFTITASRFDGPSRFGVYGAEGNWSEDAVTWDSAPTQLPDLLDSRYETSKGTYTFDVTSRLQALLEEGASSSTFWVEDIDRTSNITDFYGQTRSEGPPSLTVEFSDIAIDNLGGDRTLPSIPKNLNTDIFSIVPGTVDLAWTASTDDILVADYAIYQNGKVVGISSSNLIRVSGVDLSVDNQFAVVARDIAGNTSLLSAQVLVEAQNIDSTLVDSDGDGTSDAFDDLPLNASEQVDTDADGIGNNTDTDDDGDGVGDVQEVSDGTDPLDRSDFVDRAEPLSGVVSDWKNQLPIADVIVSALGSDK